MLRTIGNAFAIPEIRRKLAFTAAMLALYRLGAFIPAPGIDVSALDAIQSNFANGNILGFLDLFSGGALSQLSLFALGIMPYITASIILQLLTVVVPSLEKLQKEGEVGQQKITQYTRYLTVALAFAQSLGYVFLFDSFGGSGQSVVGGALTFPKVMLIVTSLTAGCVLLMWLGELITQRGIGNGISLMIFASIVSGLPNGLQAWATNPDQVFVVMMPFIAIAVIVGIVYVQEGQRRIPVQYAKRQVGRKMTTGGSTYLPLRVNMAGVIPVIFAASIMAFPPTVGQLLNTPWALDFAAFFSPAELGLHRRRGGLHHPLHLLLYGGHLQPGRPGRQPEEVRRLHPRRQTRATYRRIPGSDPDQAHLRRSPLSRRGRSPADDPDLPDLRQLLLRRHLDPDRRRRSPRHGQAARGAVDDAQLRGFSQVGRRRPCVRLASQPRARMPPAAALVCIIA